VFNVRILQAVQYVLSIEQIMQYTLFQELCISIKKECKL